MNRGTKIFLGIVISTIIILGTAAGIFYILRDNNGSNGSSNDPPLLDFPVENTTRVVMIAAYGYVDGVNFHNGIDFMINESANIIASCNMTMTDKTLFYNELGDHWQVGTSFTINDDYSLFIAFESFAENETFGTYQLNAITLEIGQEIRSGEIIGELLYHRESAHIHYMLHYKNEPVCPYEFFSPQGKTIFDTVWNRCGYGSAICINETTTTTTI